MSFIIYFQALLNLCLLLIIIVKVGTFLEGNKIFKQTDQNSSLILKYFSSIHANHTWSCYYEMMINVFRPDFLISLNKLKTSNHLPAQSPEEYQALDSSKVNTHSGL